MLAQLHNIIGNGIIALGLLCVGDSACANLGRVWKLLT